MTLRDEFFAAVKPREECVTVGGVEVVVRQLATAADVEALRDGQDAIYKFVVLCCFDRAGVPAFTMADLPDLKAAAKAPMLPLLQAVARVNGLDAGDAEKNSAASPAAA